MMTKFNRTDRAIFSIASLLLVIFIYFLYDDSILFSKSDQNQTEKIGRIYNTQNDVRRKSQDTFSWIPSSNLETVYHLDSVFTGSGSEASIQLLDGSLIHIHENSLITLNRVQGQLQLELKYGDLVSEIKTNSEIQFKSGADEYQIKGDSQNSSVAISRNRIGKNEVRSVKGKPEVVLKGTGKPLQLTSITKASPVKKVKTVVVEPLPAPVKEIELRVELLTENKTLFKKQKTADLFTLNWKSQGEISQFSVEVKSNPKDSEFAFQDKTTGKQFKLAAPLEEGLYYWRIVALDDKQKNIAQSEYREFKIMHLMPPSWIAPTTKDTVTSDLTTLNLEWSKLPCLKYEWQLATDSEFQQIQRQGTIVSPQTQIPTPKAGKYWARVRAQKDTSQWTNWSQSNSFSIQIPKLVSIPVPELLQKKLSVKPEPASVRAPASVPPVEISWKKVRTADSYLVEISSDQNFKEFKKIETKNLSYSMRQYPEAQQFVRVKAKSAVGTLSKPSETATVSLVLRQPVLKGKPTLLEKSFILGAKPQGLEVPMSWSSVYLANQYRLEIDRKKDFSAPQVVEINSNQTQVKLNQPGKYYARVRPYSKKGETLTEYSNVFEFEYLFRTTLVAPSLAEPFNKSTIFLQKDIEPYLWLEWKTTPSAVKYEIEISLDPKFKKKLISTKLDKNRFLIKEKIPYGKIFWRVRALSDDPLQNSSWSESRTFSLIFKKNENIIE